MHMKREDISAFLSDMRKAEAEIYKGSVPDEYSRPVGEPYEWECKDAKLVAEVKASGHGLWGSGNKYPPKKQ